MSDSTSRSVLWLSIGLLAVQILDVVVHVAAGEVEALRIASSVTLALVAITGFFPIPIFFRRWTVFGAGISYAVLNVVFVIAYGVVNPTSGSLRLPLVGFVVVSLVLLILTARSPSESS